MSVGGEGARDRRQWPGVEWAVRRERPENISIGGGSGRDADRETASVMRGSRATGRLKKTM